MNVRFSEGEIRFRSSQDDFEKLCHGQDLKLDAIPISFVVHAAKRDLPGGMAIDITCDGIHLVLGASEVSGLRARLPSRAGIAKALSLADGKSLNVTFEVDVTARG